MTTLNLGNIDLSTFEKGEKNPNTKDDVLADAVKQPLRASIGEAVKVNPDQHSRKLKVSQDSGVPAAIISDQVALDALETDLKLEKIDLNDLTERTPNVAKYLTDFDRAVLAQDSIPGLQKIETALTKKVESPKERDEDMGFFSAAFRTLGERTAELGGSLLEFVDQVADEAEENMGLGGFVWDEGSILPRYANAEEFKKLQEAGSQDLVAKAGEGLKELDLGAQESITGDELLELYANGSAGEMFGGTVAYGVQTLIGSIPDMVAARYVMPAYIMARSQEIGEERAKNKGLEDGTLTETLEAVPYAVGAAVLERILPKVAFDKMTNKVVAEIGDGVIRTAASKVKSVAASTGSGLLTEAATEAAQEGVIEYLGERLGTGADLEFKDAAKRALLGAIGGGVAGGVLGGTAETVKQAKETIAQRANTDAEQKVSAAQEADTVAESAAEASQSKLDEIAKAAGESPLAQRDVNEFEKAVKAADGDNETQVFADSEKVAEYLADKDVESDPALKVLSEGLKEAQALGNDVAIPVEKFAAHVSTSEHYAVLKEHMTADPDTPPPSRLEESKAQTQRYIGEVIEEAKQNANDFIESQDVYDEVKQQLVDTGVIKPEHAKVMAQVVPAWATVYAKKQGISVKEAYERSGLKIDGPSTDMNRAENIYKQGDRGYYSPSESLIRLTESSDLSTFTHEFAHFMLEMERTIPDSESIAQTKEWHKRNADAVAKEATTYMESGKVSVQDLEAFLENGTTGDKAKDAALDRATHEQFARGFETYLMEGKAPTPELQGFFASLSRWLTQIYHSIKGDLDINLDAEMREVFDRLIATEEQIKVAEARNKYAPQFSAAEQAGMTEKQFGEYKRQAEKVKDVQSKTLRDQLIKEVTRQKKDWWKAEKADLVEEQLNKLREEKVYKTARAIAASNIKLDNNIVREQVGVEQVSKKGKTYKKLPPEFRSLTQQDGLNPNDAAAVYGFQSGAELIQKLNEAPDINALAEEKAETEMKARHGDILNDGSIEALADEAVRNEERGKLLLSELKILRKQAGSGPKLDTAIIKQMAEENIGKLSFREIHPAKYRRAELKAAQDVATAMAAGNTRAATEAKTRQVINYYLGLAATAAKNDTVKILDNVARYRKGTVVNNIRKAENGYWEQMEKILNRFEFRKSARLNDPNVQIEDINTWAKARMDQDGEAIVLSNAVADTGFIRHWKNVKLSDLKGINDTLKNIEHIAKNANKTKVYDETLEFDTLVDRWSTNLDKQKDVYKADRQTTLGPQTTWDTTKAWGRWARAQMTKVPYLASWMDNFERAGLSNEILVQPFVDASQTKFRLWESVGKDVMRAITGRSKADIERHNSDIYIAEIDSTLKGNQILAVALNVGNRSNLKKLLLGEGWVTDPNNEAEITIDNPKLQAVLKHMTESDWKLVQTIWDKMDTLYPQLAEIHRKTTGLIPPKIAATPVKTQFGTFNGGYYPVKYDSARSTRAEHNQERAAAEADSMFGSFGSIHASVSASATSERTGYYAPIKLNLDVIPEHFNDTIHYISHHQAVRNVNKFIRDKRVAEKIKAKMGAEEYDQLKTWLNDIAKDGRSGGTKSFIDSIFGRLRMGATLGYMGFKASTGIMQLSGIFNTASELGSANTLRSARKVLSGIPAMREAWEFAKTNSKIMEQRTETMDREINSAMKDLQGKSGWLRAVQEASMKHIAYIQTYSVDLVTWHAAYDKGLQDHGDHKKAAREADWAVENIQGSGNMYAMASFMRNQSKTHRTFTMFMTFFSALWNMERDLVRGASKGAYSPTTVAAKIMFLFTLPVLFEMIARGDLFDEDDEIDFEKFLINSATYPFASVPVVRDVVGGVSGFTYNINPTASLMAGLVTSSPDIIKEGLTDGDISKAEAKKFTMGVGAVLAIPGTSQAWATGEHLYEVLEEGEDFTAREFLMGPDWEK